MLDSVIVDHYDDPKGIILREMCPILEDLPPLIKQAEILSQDELDTLPDEDFAVVVLDGDRRLRKFAMFDPGNIALSTAYLVRQADILPDDMVKTAADNLVEAHQIRQIPVPEELLKLASHSLMPGLHEVLQSAEPAHWQAAYDHPSVKKVVKQLYGNHPDPDYAHPDIDAAVIKVVYHNAKNQKSKKAESTSSNLVKLAFFNTVMSASPEQWRAAYDHPSVKKVAKRCNGDFSHPDVDAAAAQVVYENSKKHKHAEMAAIEMSPEDQKALQRLVYKATRVQKPKSTISKGDGTMGYPTDNMSIPDTNAGMGGVGDMNSQMGMAKMATGACPKCSASTRMGKCGSCGYSMKKMAGDAGLMADVLAATGGPRQEGRYVLAGEIKPKIAHYEPKYTLVGNRFPVDTHAQVKVAESYFLDNYGEMSPQFRHQYCSALVSRANDLDIPVHEKIASYSHHTKSDMLIPALEARKGLVPVEFHLTLDQLMRKTAEVSSDTLVEAVEEFDRYSGLDALWGSKLLDPVLTVYGPSKIAEEGEWTYSGNGYIVRSDHLFHLAEKFPKLVAHQFGEKFREEFEKNPVKAFDSLSANSKQVLARMALEHDK